MSKISLIALLSLVVALAAGPTYAAPQFGGTGGPGEAGSGGASSVDCTDQQYRYIPFCEQLNNRAAAAPTRHLRTNRAVDSRLSSWWRDPSSYAPVD